MLTSTDLNVENRVLTSIYVNKGFLILIFYLTHFFLMIKKDNNLHFSIILCGKFNTEVFKFQNSDGERCVNSQWLFCSKEKY